MIDNIREDEEARRIYRELTPYALTLLQIHEIHGILKKGEFLWIQMI